MNSERKEVAISSDNELKPVTNTKYSDVEMQRPNIEMAEINRHSDRNFKTCFALLAILALMSIIIFFIVLDHKKNPAKSADTQADTGNIIQIDSEDFSSQGKISNIPNNLKSYEPEYVKHYLEVYAKKLSWAQKDLLKHISAHPEEIQTDQYGNQYIVHKTYKRDKKCFQQGLFFLNNDIYESCGRYGFSKFGKVTLSEHRKKAIEVELLYNYPTIFAEGADYFVRQDTIVESMKKLVEDHKTEVDYFKYPTLNPRDVRFIQLTWRSRIIYVYDNKMRTISEIPLPKDIREGWGIAHDYAKDKENLWNLYKAIEAQTPKVAELFKEVRTFISDGSHIIFECHFDDNSVTVVRQHPIFLKDPEGVSIPLNHINEMEFVQDQLWVNVFLKNDIYVLDMNRDEIVRQNAGDNLTVLDETLNGIGYNPKTKQLVLTGKLWNFFYEIAILN